ncbi:multidrug effflux MFS transporter [Chitinophaga pendula]|uniref:multidrug effflux MFS transporter n=1 Tax=Chitinophaga TaxID=79328 RepID=UPI000BAFB0D2|nr:MULTISPECIES: multidrug effflux MFS transporter [Chitinophaga]ASZ12726.1 Bcr/CflA family drug resistance efflux transporter [Chitinophaga sp. MD30]UCJ09658.1 multidrug effflux MFS transporter [Chitinophaga pendula]
MTDIKTRPAFWLLILLVGFPQIAETIYTPSLPALASRLRTDDNWIQASLSIYFVGFAIGFVLWGWLADRMGRRPAILYGILLFIVGSLGCLLVTHIHLFLLSRLIQAVGAATGAVVTQTMIRDCYDEQQRSLIFARMFAVLACSPAIGPLLGGYMVNYGGITAVFTLLTGMGTVIGACAWYSLPETGKEIGRVKFRAAGMMIQMAADRHVIALGALVGIMYGMIFCFYAESPFVFIDHLRCSPAQYGWIGMCESSSAILAAQLNRSLMRRNPSMLIIQSGLWVMLSGSLVMTGTCLLPGLTTIPFIIGFAGGMFIILCGTGLAMPHCLSAGLSHYKMAIGTAGALFGLYYYVVTGGIMGVMSVLHSEYISVMPCLFIILATIALIIHLVAVKRAWYRT